MIPINFLTFKTMVQNSQPFVETVDDHDNYRLYVADGNLVFYCVLPKSDPKNKDQTIYENQYQSKKSTSSRASNVTVKNPFDSKILATGESLFKRVHGISKTIPANTTDDIDFVIPYPKAKFSGAEIFGNTHGNEVDFTVHDTDNNDLSGVDVTPETTNFKLNQFGFGVKIPDGPYSSTSNYDADLYGGMILRCTYKNNSNEEKVILVNYELHEVKA
tara:strand:- start:19900 stop:20550 length:651 start_codon:yes stop_codon:yes gene_type:complete